jgi:hypothetical protein
MLKELQQAIGEALPIVGSCPSKGEERGARPAP